MTTRYALTPAEVSKALGISIRGVYRAIANGTLEAETVAGRKLIPARALEARFGKSIEVNA